MSLGCKKLSMFDIIKKQDRLEAKELIVLINSESNKKWIVGMYMCQLLKINK